MSHNADYGFDGSFHRIPPSAQVAAIGAGSLGLLAASAFSLARGRRGLAALTGAIAAELITGTAFFVYTTRQGKFAVWDEILTELQLRGDETLLDMGCGRGAVLLAAAKRLPNGRAIGVDLWRADQTDNSRANTLANAALENVADRVEVQTGDMTELPLADNSVDVIVTSLAIHNIPSVSGRDRAVAEAARVLRPGGRLALVDIWATRRHAHHLRRLDWTDVQRRNLGWRMWWGGPWFGTHLVSGSKPAEEPA